MSINLPNTTDSLEVATSAAVQTHVVVSGRDKTTTSETPFGDQDDITTATDTQIVAPPAASTQRQVDDVEIFIVGAGTQRVTVQKDVSGTEFQLLSVLLAQGERAHYTSAMGWRMFDVFGREKGLAVGLSLLKAPTLLTSGTTFTPSLGCTAVLLEFWGGGGQGGGSGAGVAANASCGSGGSAGCYTRKFLIGVPSSFTYAIGAGGSGAAGTANGNAGGATTATINGVVYTASGGPGGLVGVAGTTSAESAAAPAAGSIAGTNGDEAHAGQVGEPGARVLGTGGLSGRGGMSNACSGSGGARRAGAGAGGAATGIGNGGGGGANLSVSTQVGGVGTAGAIRVWEFTG